MAARDEPKLEFENLLIHVPDYVRRGDGKDSQPFSTSTHSLFRRETLRKVGTGGQERTDYFKCHLVRIYRAIGKPVPYRFVDSAGRRRSMDGGCLQFVGPDGQNVVEFKTDRSGYIVAVEPKPILLAAYPESDGVASDLQKIFADRTLPETTRKQLIDARIGQGRFREEVLEEWNNRCALTGCDLSTVVRASHIKPWRVASDEERLDPDNGLPLAANIDALFDSGLISFDDDGKVLFSRRLAAQYYELVPEPRRLSRVPTAKARIYLAEHRKAKGFG